MGISLALLSSTVLAADSAFRKDWNKIKEDGEKTFNTACDKSKKEKKHTDKCGFIEFKQDFGPTLNNHYFLHPICSPQKAALG